MKKLMYTVAILVMGITASYAQKPGKEKMTAEQRAEKTATALQQKLTLTTDQKQKIQQIELERIKKNDEWHTTDKTAMKGKLEERKAFMKANKEKIDAVLTADQKKTFSASRDEMKQKIKNRRGEGKGHKGPKGEKTTSPPTEND